MNKSSYLPIKFTNLMKFVACILVSLHHYSNYYSNLGNDINIFYKLLSYQGGYLGVAIFFFLSGYGLMESHQSKSLSFLVFIKHRVLKIYKPVLFITICWILLLIATGHYEYISLEILIYDLFYGFKDSVLWFIHVLMILYIMFGIYTYIYPKYCNKTSVAILIILTTVVTIITISTESYYKSISVPAFSVGILLSQYSSIIKIFFINKYSLSIWIITISSLILFRDNTLFVHAWINYCSILIIIHLFSLISIRLAKLPDFSFLSYDIYLVHNKIILLCITIGVNLQVWEFIIAVSLLSILTYSCRKHLNI